MAGFRQIIRWGIPGWLSVILLLILMAIALFIAEVLAALAPSLQSCVSLEVRLSAIRGAANLALPLAGAGVPFGFVIYQVYFWTYWSAPLPCRWRRAVDPAQPIMVFAKQDWGREFSRRMRRTPPSACGRRRLLGFDVNSARILRVYQDNWHLADAVWYRALRESGAPRSVVQSLIGRADFLGDLYHALGATVIVAYGSLMAYVCWEFVRTLKVVNDSGRPTSLVFLLIAIPGVLWTQFLVRIVRSNRHNTLWTLQAFRRDFITQMYPDRARFKPKWRADQSGTPTSSDSLASEPAGASSEVP